MKAPYIPSSFDNFDKVGINRVTPLTAKEQYQLRRYLEKLDDPLFQARFASYHFERQFEDQVPEIKPVATPKPAVKAEIEPKAENIFAQEPARGANTLSISKHLQPNDHLAALM